MPTAKTLFHVTGTVRGIGNINIYRHAFSGNQAKRIVAAELEKQYPNLRIFIENADAQPSLPRQKVIKVRTSSPPPRQNNPPPCQLSLV